MTTPVIGLLPLVVTRVTVFVVTVEAFRSFENPAVRTGPIDTPTEALAGETPRIVGAVLSTAAAVLK